MAIKPIASTDCVSRDIVNFEGGRKKRKNTDSCRHQSSAMKAVPVAILIAMSPLNQSSAVSEYNRMAASPRTELSVQTPQKPNKQRISPSAIRDINGSTFSVWGVSRDDNPDDAETMLFKYVKELGDNKVAVVAGQFFAISDTPDENDRFLMLYSSMDDSGHLKDEFEIAYIPRKFVVPPNHAVKSPANNNACGYATMEDFIYNFGEEAVKNAPNIEDCANMVLTKAKAE